ncbi:histidine kinase dimerization/phospho-acceptor domain-containing protein (plasmid) [Pseudoalteromonas espejiana]
MVHKQKGDEFVTLAKHINTMLQSIEENFALVQGITDNIAHDLKTPLTRLRLHLENEAIKQPSLGIAIEQLESVLHTFDAMLKLTRLEHGQFPLKLEAVNGFTLMSDIIDILEPTADQNQQQITLLKTHELIFEGDKNLLFQACYNLLQNAIKYAGNGAKITITLSKSSIKTSDNGKVNNQQLSQESNALQKRPLQGKKTALD